MRQCLKRESRDEALSFRYLKGDCIVLPFRHLPGVKVYIRLTELHIHVVNLLKKTIHYNCLPQILNYVNFECKKLLKRKHYHVCKS